MNEETEVLSTLPRGTCQGSSVISKSWDLDPPFICDDSPIPNPAPTPVTTAPNPNTTAPSTRPTTEPAPTPTTPTTPAPAPTPTAPAPTPTGSEGCADSPLRFRTLNFAGTRVVWRGCDWVGNKPYRCNDDDLAAMCPVTCDVCDEFACEDAPMRFKVDKDGQKIARDCNWVGTRSTRYRCSLDGVSETCPETCDSCTGADKKKNIFE